MTDGAIRASDAEREAAIERLRGAAAEGRLTLEELADRIEAAGTARTRGELAKLTDDLPAAAEIGSLVAAPTRNSTVFGDQRRSGAWPLPRRSSWETVFGDVSLDLREAHVPTGEIAIEAKTVFGDVELLVPEGVAVEIQTRTVLGDVKQEAAMASVDAPRIVLTGWTVFGDVRVRTRRLRERLLERLRGGSG